ncbi:MAG TPA: hypothetical protein VFB54_19080 [Burkholderiales bacterium]|nr:hypothetical protein [Burkholderiales bacterium]
MSYAYDGLVATGAIGSLKRDILLEASHDIYCLAHIRRWFAETAGAEAAKLATACTVRVVRELIDKNLCSLATWGKEKGAVEEAAKTPEELFELVDRYKDFGEFPFDFFVVASESGRQ